MCRVASILPALVLAAAVSAFAASGEVRGKVAECGAMGVELYCLETAQGELYNLGSVHEYGEEVRAVLEAAEARYADVTVAGEAASRGSGNAPRLSPAALDGRPLVRRDGKYRF